MAIVAFNAPNFRARYPEFSAVPTATLNAYFTEATLYLDNTDGSPVGSLVRREMLLNMLAAHVGCLNGALSADGNQLPVGRVSAGSEGSVAASLEYMAAGSHSWFTQTQYGAAYWQATLNYRSFTYVAQPTTYR